MFMYSLFNVVGLGPDLGKGVANIYKNNSIILTKLMSFDVKCHLQHGGNIILMYERLIKWEMINPTDNKTKHIHDRNVGPL